MPLSSKSYRFFHNSRERTSLQGCVPWHWPEGCRGVFCCFMDGSRPCLLFLRDLQHGHVGQGTYGPWTLEDAWPGIRAYSPWIGKQQWLEVQTMCTDSKQEPQVQQWWSASMIGQWLPAVSQKTVFLNGRRNSVCSFGFVWQRAAGFFSGCSGGDGTWGRSLPFFQNCVGFE